MNQPFLATDSWKRYESALEKMRRSGLFETVRRNEKFYLGEQWEGTQTALPQPVFNLVRRIFDYLIGTLSPKDVSLKLTDERLPYFDSSARKTAVENALDLLGRHLSCKFSSPAMQELIDSALLRSAVTGDAVFYCRWDASLPCGQPFCGDVTAELVRNTNFFLCDPALPDLQKQEWIILSGRAFPHVLQNEAMQNGIPQTDAVKIQPDGEFDDEKTTYLLKFYKENGHVFCEKSVKNCVLKKFDTGLSLYPFAVFHWLPTDTSHAVPPVSELIPNQRYINGAFALVMKHMSDTAFSKVIYDKSRIPEWNSDVGEAIATMGGGNVADAVSVVGVGQLENGYGDLIDRVITYTRSMTGATESALGDTDATNTSAILALQQASKVGLGQVSARLAKTLGEVAEIYLHILLENYPNERKLPLTVGEKTAIFPVDYKALRHGILHATARLGTVDKLTSSATVTLLDHLLDGGHITARQYLEHLPDGCLSGRDSLLRSLEEDNKNLNERKELSTNV